MLLSVVSVCSIHRCQMHGFIFGTMHFIHWRKCIGMRENDIIFEFVERRHHQIDFVGLCEFRRWIRSIHYGLSTFILEFICSFVWKRRTSGDVCWLGQSIRQLWANRRGTGLKRNAHGSVSIYPAWWDTFVCCWLVSSTLGGEYSSFR